VRGPRCVLRGSDSRGGPQAPETRCPGARGHSPRAANDDRASAWRDPTPRDRTQLHTPNGCAQGPTRRGGRGEGGTTPTPYRGRPRGGVPPGAPREVFVLNQYIAAEDLKVSVLESGEPPETRKPLSLQRGEPPRSRGEHLAPHTNILRRCFYLRVALYPSQEVPGQNRARES